MKLIDYDALFNEYLNAWMKENRDKYDTADKMELAVEDVYFQWLEENKDSFSNYSADELVEYFIEYSKSDISVPDMLCDAIVEKKETEALLFDAVSSGKLADGALMMGVNLLMQMQSCMGVELYLKWILEGERENELAEIATEALVNMDEYPRQAVVSAFKSTENEWAKERLAEIISYYKSNDELFRLLADMFIEKPVAMTAVWLTRLNDVRAIELLKNALNNPEVDYLDYLEIKNSLESFGEEVTATRDFSGDDNYEKIKDLGLDK